MSFHVDIVAPEAVVWSGDADFLVAKTVEGEIGVLTDHEPLMAALATGVVVVEAGDEKVTVGMHGGFLQIVDNNVTLLTDRAKLTEGDDRGRALEVAKRLRAEEEAVEG
ncbi:MAG: F0F1 ATP synthase subunit epsilon [Gammaproteobacteria bacterium]|nr:F0F1 ATP synthase subunit epsilon [Gammaproteobacteria bacterium]